MVLIAKLRFGVWFLLVKSTAKRVALNLLKVSTTIYLVNYTPCVVDPTESWVMAGAYFWFLLVKSTAKGVALSLLKVSTTIYVVNYTLCVVDLSKPFWTTL